MELFYSNNDSPLSIYTAPTKWGYKFSRAREPLREGNHEGRVSVRRRKQI